jgi:hypothetical protein
MKSDIQLKRLADRYFFSKASLTKQEKTLLENSKYSHIIEEDSDSKLDSLIKRVNGGESFNLENEYSNPKKVKKSNAYSSLDKNELKNLVDGIDLEFHLDLSNPSPFKYNKVDVQKLKDFIRKSINLYMNCMFTTEYVNNIINNDSLESTEILGRLYNSAGV